MKGLFVAPTSKATLNTRIKTDNKVFMLTSNTDFKNPEGKY